MYVGFVFTNFNNSQFTIDLIETIKEMKANNYEIVIVDNASEPRDVSLLNEVSNKITNLHIIYSGCNLGYFSGLNLGIQYLRENKPECQYYVVGNNDLYFPPNFLQMMCELESVFAKYPVISPDIITLNGEHQNPHVISGISRFREIIYNLYHFNFTLAKFIVWLAKATHKFTDRKDEQLYEFAREIYQGYGACYILTPLFFEHFDELWSPSFLMYEEYFLSKQLSEVGLKKYYEPRLCVTHRLHGTTGRLTAKTKWLYSRDSHRIYRQHVGVFSGSVQKENI